jgi:hypothetical protein
MKLLRKEHNRFMKILLIVITVESLAIAFSIWYLLT